jgi:hypothetical protein
MLIFSHSRVITYRLGNANMGASSTLRWRFATEVYVYVDYAMFFLETHFSDETMDTLFTRLMQDERGTANWKFSKLLIQCEV